MTGQDMPWIWTALLWSLFVLLAGLEVYYPHDARAPFRDQRWPVNLALGILNASLAALVPVTAIWLAVWANQHDFGLLNWASLSDSASIVATWIAYSFATYALHRLSHTLPWLWRIHRIHHCDPHVDVSTTLRHHPLETVASTLFLGAVATILGLSPSGIISYELLAFVIGAASHSNIAVPAAVNRAVGWLVVTPAFHRMHHSIEQAETDSNFADVFALWDWLGGTYKQPREAVQCGLHEVTAQEAGSLTSQLQMPWLKIETTRPKTSSRTPIE